MLTQESNPLVLGKMPIRNAFELGRKLASSQCILCEEQTFPPERVLVILETEGKDVFSVGIICAECILHAGARRKN